MRAVESGATAIVAQGAEAGGHRSNFTVPPDGVVPMIGTLALVPQVVDAVDVPVIAPAASWTDGAWRPPSPSARRRVQMGTRFLVAAESGVSEGYRRRIIRSRDTDTVVTRAVSGRPARGLSNRLITALEEAGPPGLGYPRQGGGERRPARGGRARGPARADGPLGRAGRRVSPATRRRPSGSSRRSCSRPGACWAGWPGAAEARRYDRNRRGPASRRPPPITGPITRAAARVRAGPPRGPRRPTGRAWGARPGRGRPRRGRTRRP